MKAYDVVVLGAGPGGYVAAIRSAQLGKKVAIIESRHIGGVCLNVGCIPTKALIKNAEIMHNIKKGPMRGIYFTGMSVDMPKMIEAKNKTVKQLVSGVNLLLRSNDVDIYDGFGTAVDHKTITVALNSGGSETIGFQNLIVATGSLPLIPGGMETDGHHILDSTHVLDLAEVPKDLVIIGGGVIGCEMATIWNALGSNVTIVEMADQLVSSLDFEVAEALRRSLAGKKIKILLGHKVEQMAVENGGVQIQVSGSGATVLRADKVLVSIGRRANLAGLEALELDLERGWVTVDDYMKTNQKGIYAIGDVTGKMLLAHVASAQGIVAAETIAGLDAKPLNMGAVPSCIYTLPEIGSVGMTEAAAKEAYGELLIGRFPLVASGKAVAMGESQGMFKIIARKDTGVVVGAHIMAPAATEIIAELTLAVELGTTMKELGDTIHAHPTISECVMEAIHDAFGHCINMPKR